jgi:hypothetical protein
MTGANTNVALGEIVTAVARWIDRYCKVPANGFAQTATATRYYDEGRVYDDVLMLDAPLLSVTTLVTAGGATLTSGQYRLQPRNGDYYSAIKLLSGVAWGWTLDGEIAVTGAWGMAAAVPEPVREAAIMLTAWTYKRYTVGLQDATANLDLGQLVYAKGMPEQVTTLLSGYRWTVL